MITDHYYFLLDAYDRLGAWLFGPDWTSQEINQSPLRSPEEIEAEREPLEKELEELEVGIADLRTDAKKLLKESEIAENQEATRSLHEKRSNLLSQLRDIGEATPYYRDTFAAYERRRVTELRLREALGAGELVASLLSSLNVPAEMWRGKRGFKCYLELSSVVVPSTFSGQRHHATLIERRQFDNWLNGIVPLVIDDQAPPSPAIRCRAYLREQVKMGRCDRAKSDYRDEALAKFPGLSRRQFDQIWNEVVPDEWKRPGRRKGR